MITPQDSVFVKEKKKKRTATENAQGEGLVNKRISHTGSVRFDWRGSGDDLHWRYEAAAFLFQLRLSTSGLFANLITSKMAGEWGEWGGQLSWQIGFTWTTAFYHCF